MNRLANIRLALAFKDFAYWVGYSSVGLNVAAITTAEYLNHHGIKTEVFSVRHNIDLFHKIKAAQDSDKPLTHVVIMAPWITPRDLEALIKYFPCIEFAVQFHCNVGAIHGDYRGTGNLRNYIDLMFSYPNLHVASNSARFARWASAAYDADVVLLPNLYPLKKIELFNHPSLLPIKIGSFGAIRKEKNFITACAAALVIQKNLGAPVQFHISVGGESMAKDVLDAISQMTDGVPGFNVVKHRWMAWDKFHALVRQMDILLQPSYTESFNMVTADGVLAGVPSVVSTAIEWAPEDWKADSDDAVAIADCGLWMLENLPKAREQGVCALEVHDKFSLHKWKEYLKCTDPGELPWPYVCWLRMKNFLF
jgi:hypothetical protein